MTEVVQIWYANFANVEQEVLFELILAANYMDIKPLLDLTCATVASMIKGKTPEEIRKTFNIVNDFTPEEEAQVREEPRFRKGTELALDAYRSAFVCREAKLAKRAITSSASTSKPT